MQKRRADVDESFRQTGPRPLLRTVKKRDFIVSDQLPTEKSLEYPPYANHAER